MTCIGERETNYGQFGRLSRRPDPCQPRYHPRAASDADIAADREAVYATITAAIAEGADHRLTLSSNLGEPVPLTTKVHFLTATRADADRVEIQHGSVASEVTLPVVEVPG